MQPQISTRKPELKLFAIEDLIGAPFNPERRTEKQNLAALRAAILALGFVAYPPLVSREGRILDGHRRVAIYRELGVREVWCIIVPTGLVETFMAVNTSAAAFNSRDWVLVAQAGVLPEYVPGKQGRRLSKLAQLGGSEVFDDLAANKLGTGIVDVVKEVSRATGLTDESGQRRILQWLIDFGLQRRAREAIALGGRAELQYAIVHMCPLVVRNGAWSVPGAPPMRVANEDESEPVDYAQE